MKKKSGFIFNNIIGVLALAIFGYFYSENQKDDLQLVKYKIKTKKDIKRDIKIVFLSDLHDKDFGNNNQKIIDMIDEVSPDVVLIGGDMITSKNPVDLDTTLKLCKRISEKYLVYYAPGNHEERLKTKKYNNIFDEFIKELRKLNIKYLEDDSVIIEDDFVISGLNIDKAYYKKIKFKNMTDKYIQNKLGKSSSKKFNILLAHSPNFFEAYKNWGSDLTFCGHFHGGTIRLDEQIGLMTPQIQFFNTNVVGMKSLGLSKMIISAGLGTHTVNLRINNRPQVVVAQICKDI